MAGETAVGFIQAVYVKPFQESRQFSEEKNSIQLREMMFVSLASSFVRIRSRTLTYSSTFSLQLSSSLTSEALKILFDHGLDKRCQVAHQILQTSLKDAQRNETEGIKIRRNEAGNNMQESEAALQIAIKNAMIRDISKRFA
jgi:hypothetical protein